MEDALRKQGMTCHDQGLITQLDAAAVAHGLTPREVACKMSAHFMSKGVAVAGRAISSPATEQFIAALQRECNKENHARGSTTPATKWNGRDWGGLAETLGAATKAEPDGLAATPARGRGAAAPAASGADGTKASPATPHSAPRSAFKARTNRSQVVTTFNAHIPRASGDEARVIHVEAGGVQLPQRHLYLMERLEDKVAAVNARIGAWRRWLQTALAAETASASPAPASAPAAAGAGEKEDTAAAGGGRSTEILPVGVPVQEESMFVGRVVCEVEGGHLNDTSVVLEGDTARSEGARVALDLSSTASFRLFPGQVIAVRGVNPSGSRIMARSIWTHLPPPPSRNCGGSCSVGSNMAAPMDIDGSSSGTGLGSSGGLSAVVAAGPFCLSDDLAFEPLHELLQELKLRPPNLVLLLGPFVDVEQPLIAGGMIDMAYHQLFQTQVVERLQAWQAALPAPCQVVLMPSVRDVFHHPTYPQPAFNLPADQHMVSLQNPCSFTAGPALLAATTTDVLRHLSSVELARVAAGGPPPDRLAALASHLIGQRRMYPLYPAPPGTCLDLTGDAVLQLQELPELMLLPSDLAPFAKMVPAAAPTAAGGCYMPTQGDSSSCSQVVVVNPGRLAKASSGGTYAHITVADGSGSVASRCRVDIVRV